MKIKTVYRCQECGTQFSKWAGHCSGCNAWNSIVEETLEQQKPSKYSGYVGDLSTNTITALCDVNITEKTRVSSGCAEFDRVLGGGLVAGSVIMLGGDPGIGKTTILLQNLAKLAQQQVSVLYVTGEESLEQIGLRAEQISITKDNMYLLAETQIETIVKRAKEHVPQIMVIDSIQTIYTTELNSAPGSVSQVRESAMRLVQFAKQTATTIFFIGHVTKDGALAGPRVLEHMVDTVLYFEGDRSSRFRMIRAVKNRFGAVSELGVFAMTDNGLKAVSNPSAIFLSRDHVGAPGSVVTVGWEGTRPLLLEVQALVDDNSSNGNARRLSIGLDNSRVAMLLALIHRYLALQIHSQDIFVNVVGGIKITETSVDLAIVAALISSLKNKEIAENCIIFGELGLAGEVRPVPNGQLRIQEAQKHGFSKALVPKANLPKQKIAGIKIIAISKISDLTEHLY